MSYIGPGRFSPLPPPPPAAAPLPVSPPPPALTFDNAEETGRRRRPFYPLFVPRPPTHFDYLSELPRRPTVTPIFPR